MKIEVLYIEDCPHHLPAVDLIRTILREEGLPVEISGIEVKDAATAKALRFSGSPTIRIDGIDIEPDACSVTETGLACRRYPGGVPSGQMIRTAIREALHRSG